MNYIYLLKKQHQLFNKYYLSIIIGCLAFLSYNYNALMITSDDYFRTYQLDSEQLILDGILHGNNENGKMSLGRYSRPNIKNQSTYSHQLYLDRNKQSVFREYRSQFGLQLYVYNFIGKTINYDVRILQAFSSFLMSLIVSLFFIIINREFSLKHALAFCIPLIISPWVVVFAKNLYWVEAAWYLPTIVAFFFGRTAFTSFKSAALLGIMLFLGFLLKMLCGYEYITTIALSACVPIIYYATKYKINAIKSFYILSLAGLSFFLAFCLALTIHANSLSTDLNNGFREIYYTTTKRVAIGNPELAAKEACKGSDNPSECQKIYINSLKSNNLTVVGKYFIMPHFLPWIDRISITSKMSTSDRILLMKLKSDHSFQTLYYIISRVDLFNIILFVIEKAGFIIFCIFAFIASFNKKSSLSLGILVAFSAALSWYFLAKGHSYIHYHMNYVLWYLPFIPLSMLIFIKKNKQ
jgi:hypothetical protein